MAAKSKVEAKKDNGIFGTFWDVVVVGAGYSGFAATMASVAAGKRTLLVEPGCGLLWESARARNTVVGKMPPEMAQFMHAMEVATGIAEDWIDPGSAEWIANELLLKAGVPRLYFATPVSCEPPSQGLMSAVTFSLEDRLATISASQWVDATEDGLLCRACGVEFETATPIKRIYRFFLQRSRWPVKFPFDVFTGIYGTYGQMEDSGWSSEKIMRLEIGNAFKGEPLDVFEPFLAAMRKRLSAKCPDALLSHWSWTPYPLFPRQINTIVSPCQNLAIAVPMLSPAPIETLGDRCALGAAAFARLHNSHRAAKRPAAAPKPVAPKATRAIEADVCVIGLGTGGLMAAISASRGGAKVLALEAETTIGGMATIGGVRSYHMGCTGGLQDEMDVEIKRLMPVCVTPRQPKGCYHGVARMVASDVLLRKSKAKTILGARIISGTAMVKDGRIVSILATTPDGIAEIRAKSWIDATGDAVLAAAAGVKRIRPVEAGAPRLQWTQSADFIGFDGADTLVSTPRAVRDGVVDSTSSEALTAARIDTVHGIVEKNGYWTSNSFHRLLGLAPEMGIRGRAIAATRHKMSLDDLFEHRRFEDAIGFTAGRVGDIPAEEIAESADLSFYVTTCGLGGVPLGCEIPYGVVVAEGVDNLWIASRAAGGTPEAAAAFRMIRDIQRVGEAAGNAAAIAAKTGVAAGDVPMQRMKAALLMSGALKTWRPPKQDPYASAVPENPAIDPVFLAPATASNAKKWVAAIGGGNNGLALWRLYRMGKAALPKEVERLAAGKTSKAAPAAALLEALGKAKK